MMNQDFDAAAYEAFEQAALDKYDFQTCQRADGSYYGTGGTCRKGSPVKGTPKKKTKKMADMRAKDLKRRGVDGKNHGKTVKASGGGATLDKASRAEYGKQAKTERQSAKDIKSEMRRNGKTPGLEKKLKQAEARATKFERMSKTGVFEK